MCCAAICLPWACYNDQCNVATSESPLLLCFWMTTSSSFLLYYYYLLSTLDLDLINHSCQSNKQENEHINVKRQHKDEHVFALAKDRAVFKRSGVPYRVLLCEKESHALPYDIDRITWRNHHTLMMHMFMHGKWKVLYYDHANKTSSRKVYLCSTCQDAGVMDRSYQWQYSTCLHCAFE